MNKTIEPDNNAEHFAFSEGELRPLNGVPLSDGAKRTLSQLVNHTSALDCDEHSRNKTDSSNFPDGHAISPFRVRIWDVVNRETAERLMAASPEQKAEWTKLHEADEARREKYRRESALWFESLGRYVTSFEGLMSEVIRLIKALLRKGGLESVALRNAVIADQAARQLLRIAKTMYNQHAAFEESEISVAKNIFNRIDTCIESRNDVVHSNWLPGGPMPMINQHFLLAHGAKFKSGNAGVSWQQRGYSVESLDWLRARCASTRTLVSDLVRRVRTDQPINSFMTLDSNGVLKRELDYTHITGQRIVEEHISVLRDPPNGYVGQWADPDGGAGGDVGAMRLSMDEIDELVPAIWKNKESQ